MWPTNAAIIALKLRIARDVQAVVATANPGNVVAARLPASNTIVLF